MSFSRELLRHGWLMMLVLILSSNMLLYHTTFGVSIIPENSNGVVIGSIIDLAIVSPILFIAWIRKWSWKYIVSAIAIGLILTRFLIPFHYLQPFAALTWIGFIAEGVLILIELSILISLFVYIPKIIKLVKQSALPVLFSFHQAVQQMVNNAPIIHIICSEMLMFYYAFASWRKQPKLTQTTFTLHQNSSFIALRIMLIHAIVIESIGIHWWLHNISPVVAVVLLIFNIYGVILLLGDIQAVRLNPTLVTNEKLYVSLGLMKRMELEWSNVERIIHHTAELDEEKAKETVDFIAQDLEKVTPTVILELRKPTQVVLIMGFKKQYRRVAIRVDEPERFVKVLRNKLETTVNE
ncbi:beta-carotene 15,15'-monooxygenase [Ornithinibacillus sp. BX22]|uniref:Beta-carotene 15,15'-monooxygenase n=2 Tax=Ornithinibacillus TaxID=484508 RepID=A0A923L6F9_9BACI|nr:beta-carotene 15,15'-monooxygenase [Ornithinibacillus hominis]MBC5637377.1 beta-carotene 15,15'-monooxygenase [Ornithinibacillus hominis]